MSGRTRSTAAHDCSLPALSPHRRLAPYGETVPWDNSNPDKRKRDSRVYGARWRKARDAQLRRQPDCELQLPGCTRKATEVDHIYGADSDPDHRHLRSACHGCHAKRTAAEQGLGYRAGRQADPSPKRGTAW